MPGDQWDATRPPKIRGFQCFVGTHTYYMIVYRSYSNMHKYALLYVDDVISSVYLKYFSISLVVGIYKYIVLDIV